VSPFEIIPVKIVASNLELSAKKYINFEGLKVHFFEFLKKKIENNELLDICNCG
jgi:hypothetical protein